MAVVLHTTHGDLPVLLKCAECPAASFNFLALCAARYYDDCAFYRHIPGILLQTGDPSNTGKGGESIFAKVPARTATTTTTTTAVEEAPRSDIVFPPHVCHAGPTRYFEDEGFGTTAHAARGTLSMAHKGTKTNTNASQFFVLTSAQPSFDGLYTSFGNVDLLGAFDPATRTIVGKESGIPTGDEVLAALEAAAKDVDDKNMVRQKDAVRIKGATVLVNPFADGTVRL